VVTAPNTDVPSAFDVVALASSAGGIEAITAILRTLPRDFPAAVFVLMHLPATISRRRNIFSAHSALPVAWAEPGDPFLPGRVYVAPPGSALEIEPDATCTVVDRPNSKHPIDETLVSLAESYGRRALVVILTGMLNDGARGVRAIKHRGGTVLVQSPESAQHPAMPKAAMATGVVDLVLPLSEIGRALDGIVTKGALPPSRERVAAVDSVFGGPGEMRAIYRQIDWAASPLGPVESWSPELKATVRLVLSSPIPMVSRWGPKQVLFYNDSHAPALGAHHPAAAGSTTLHCSSRDLYDRALGTGEAFAEQNKRFELSFHGRPEEHYFTIAVLPVASDSGVEGTLNLFVETTDDVLAKRRMQTLGKLAAASRSASLTEAYTALLASFDDNPYDLPFVVAYEVDAIRKQAMLKATVRVDAGTPMAPHVVDFASQRALWPLANVVDSRASLTVSDLSSRFAETVVGPWEQPITEALLLPLTTEFDGAPIGILVVGLNRRRQLDAAYREFLDVVASQISAAIVQARAFRMTRDRSEALVEANRVKTEFFSNVSHEFRTPLTLIIGPLERALSRTRDLPAEVSLDLEVATRNAQRLLGLVSSLLDFAQAESHRLTPEFEPVDLAIETEHVAALLRTAIEHAGLRFTVECARVESIQVDRAMWAKIVVNLLANALKFTFEGEIRVVLRERAQHAELVVSDTGVGIAAADQPHVFERFFRSRGQRARSNEGTGIGLALVKELVQLHRGRIRVTSEEGRGTSFTVWIPKSPLHSAGTRATTPDRSSADAALAKAALAWLRPAATAEAVVREPAALEGLDAIQRNTAGARVLVMDDNADMRDYLQRLLLEMGWRVDTVDDGDEAFERARASRPDLVVADVMMPRSDGFELLRRIRGDASVRSIPVVLVTARAGESAAVEGLLAGADDYIAKPFTSRELVARLGAQIQLARARHRAERLDTYRVKLVDALAAFDDPVSLQRTACQVLGEWLGASRTLYGEFQDGKLATMAGNHAPGSPPRTELEDSERLVPWIEASREGQTEVVHDVDADSGLDETTRASWRRLGVRSGILSRVVEDGKVVAFMAVHTTEARGWSNDDLLIVRETAQRTRETIKRAQAEAALQTSEAALAKLNDASSRLWRMTTLQEGLDEMLVATMDLVGADKGNIQVNDASRGALTVATQRGFATEFLAYFDEVDADHDSAGRRALRSNRTVTIEDVEEDAAYASMREVARAAGYRSVQSIPLIDRTGLPLGVISVHWTKPHRCSELELRLLDLYARQAADFMERCRSDERRSLAVGTRPAVRGNA
jgi:signal transduction histidine kinase/chemotaxis response regulator CheB